MCFCDVGDDLGGRRRVREGEVRDIGDAGGDTGRYEAGRVNEARGDGIFLVRSRLEC